MTGWDRFELVNNEIDWLGNNCIHNLIARSEIDIQVLKMMISEYSHFLSASNLAGRIPLHYAVDRSRVNTEALQILLDAYPEGMNHKDNENMTPYELILKWEHPKPIHWMFLSRMPSLDQEQYLKLKYGPFGSLAVWVSTPSKKTKESGEEFDLAGDENENEDNESEDDEPETQLEYEHTGHTTQASQQQNLSEIRPEEYDPTPIGNDDDDRVVAFEPILHSGSVKTRKSIGSTKLVPTLPIQDIPSRRRYSVSSVHSFDDSDVTND